MKTGLHNGPKMHTCASERRKIITSNLCSCNGWAEGGKEHFLNEKTFTNIGRETSRIYGTCENSSRIAWHDSYGVKIRNLNEWLNKIPLANLRKQASLTVKSGNFVISLNKSNIHERSVTPSSVPTVRIFRQAAPGHTNFFSVLHAIKQYWIPYILADKGVT